MSTLPQARASSPMSAVEGKAEVTRAEGDFRF